MARGKPHRLHSPRHRPLLLFRLCPTHPCTTTVCTRVPQPNTTNRTKRRASTTASCFSSEPEARSQTAAAKLCAARGCAVACVRYSARRGACRGMACKLQAPRGAHRVTHAAAAVAMSGCVTLFAERAVRVVRSTHRRCVAGDQQERALPRTVGGAAGGESAAAHTLVGGSLSEKQKHHHATIIRNCNTPHP